MNVLQLVFIACAGVTGIAVGVVFVQRALIREATARIRVLDRLAWVPMQRVREMEPEEFQKFLEAIRALSLPPGGEK